MNLILYQKIIQKKIINWIVNYLIKLEDKLNLNKNELY